MSKGKLVVRPEAGSKNERKLHEVVEVTQNCEIGESGERAVVVRLEDKYMTLLFPYRQLKYQREVHTGADYLYLKTV